MMNNIQLDNEYVRTLQPMVLDDFVKYDLSGQWLIVKILKVHDTDTMTIGWKDHDRFVKTNIRLSGLDAPELKSKKEKESKLCRLGRNWVASNYLNKIAVVECLDMDKYGRILANVFDYYDNTICINKFIVDNKLARVYGGNLHKDDWTETELDDGIECADKLGVIDV